MRARSIVALSVGSAALCAGLVACFDLFHSTRDIRTACEIDAQTSGCGLDAGGDGAPSLPGDGGDGGTDFCAWLPSDARHHAELACAWLGACETPMGRNAFGPCMFQALLAYDCAANPNHRVHGKTRDRWECLSHVTTCDDVDNCIFSQQRSTCGSSGSYTACANDGGSAPTDVRIECADGGTVPYPNAHGENCALWGQTCSTNGSSSICAGGAGPACAPSGCSGPTRTELHWCIDGGDVGLDCASNGGQRCDGFPLRDAGGVRWVACLAESNTGSTCAPDAAAACSNGVAVSCPSGVPETINCASLLQSDAGGGCTAGPLAPPFDWTSPCAVTPPVCTTDSCTDAGLLLGCLRGSQVAIDCTVLNLGPCRTVWTETHTAQRSACSPP